MKKQKSYFRVITYMKVNSENVLKLLHVKTSPSNDILTYKIPKIWYNTIHKLYLLQYFSLKFNHVGPKLFYLFYFLPRIVFGRDYYRTVLMASFVVFNRIFINFELISLVIAWEIFSCAGNIHRWYIKHFLIVSFYP